MIRNVNGFYSPHYFDSLLQRDLHEFAAQHTLGAQPWRRLANCASAYFDARTHALQDSAESPPRADDAPHPTLDLHARLLDALGYTPNPHTVFLDDGTPLPLLARLERDGQDWLWILETTLDPDADPLDQPLVDRTTPRNNHHREPTTPRNNSVPAGP
ncbi:MAG: hypothetical protein EA398_17875, partial [Deltaproteobacteria bacterium]